MKVYNNEVKESCAEVVCPYCNGKHFIVANHYDNRCMKCKKPLSTPQVCITDKEVGRLKYHQEGWVINDVKMLRRFKDTYKK